MLEKNTDGRQKLKNLFLIKIKNKRHFFGAGGAFLTKNGKKGKEKGGFYYKGNSSRIFAVSVRNKAGMHAGTSQTQSLSRCGP